MLFLHQNSFGLCRPNYRHSKIALYISLSISASYPALGIHPERMRLLSWLPLVLRCRCQATLSRSAGATAMVSMTNALQLLMMSTQLLTAQPTTPAPQARVGTSPRRKRQQQRRGMAWQQQRPPRGCPAYHRALLSDVRAAPWWDHDRGRQGMEQSKQ